MGYIGHVRCPPDIQSLYRRKIATQNIFPIVKDDENKLMLFLWTQVTTTQAVAERNLVGLHNVWVV